MDFINSTLGVALGYVMYFCYRLVSSYGGAIILFTLVSKLILLPVSMLVQKNSIKMVKLQPELNAIRERYAGDKDRIAEEQIKVYDKEHYSPALGCLPMLLQIPLVLGLICVIYNPLQHLLHIDGAVIDQLTALVGATGSGAQMRVIAAVQAGGADFSAFAPEVLTAIRALNLSFLGFNLSDMPGFASATILFPILAGLSAYLLCFVQDRANVLQREQSRGNQIGMTVFMICFSAYFAFIVPCGVGLYWIFSNLFAILQLFLLNRIYDPKQYIDYANRPKPLTKEQLAAKKAERAFAKTKERADLKRFYDVANWDKPLVVYSERGGFYKYFSDMLDWLLANTDIPIHYVTSDARDPIFTLAEKRGDNRIHAYFVGDEKLASFFLRLECNVLLMTMPDLGQFHIKRSMASKAIEYVYCFHYPLSTHMVLRDRALADYDTVLLVGDFQCEEIRQAEKLDGTPEKRLVTCGYGLLEQLQRRFDTMEQVARERPKLLIAPSWQPDNILDSCIDPLLQALLGKGYEVVVRPHPEYVKRYRDRLDRLLERYKDVPAGDLTFELDFAKDASLYDSDLVVSDWSGTAYEFAFITKRPVLFVDTPPKINNPRYAELTVPPLEMTLRDRIGMRIAPDQLDTADALVAELLRRKDDYRETITAIRDELIANFGRSGEVGGRFLADEIAKKRAQK